MAQLTRDELIGLVEQIITSAGSEEEVDALVERFGRSVPHPDYIDLIYYSDDDLTAEEIVDLALAYRPIQL